MKKTLTLFMVVAMILSMSIATFAAADDFLQSPSKDLAPEIVETENESDDCTGDIGGVSFGDRDKLDPDQKEQFEDAYDSIIEADDLEDLNNQLTGNDIAIGDLFGITSTDCEDHDQHGDTLIKIEIDNADKFNKLIAFDGEKWVVVEGATVSGNTLTFSSKISNFSVFAIVVNTASDAPQTGDTFSWIYVALMVASATGFVAVCVSMRKKRD